MIDDVVPTERIVQRKFLGLAWNSTHQSKEDKLQTFGTKYV